MSDELGKRFDVELLKTLRTMVIKLNQIESVMVDLRKYYYHIAKNIANTFTDFSLKSGDLQKLSNDIDNKQTSDDIISIDTLITILQEIKAKKIKENNKT